MIKIACSSDADIEIVDSNTIIVVVKLLPFTTKERYSGFPPLSKNIYKWCLKNRCRYKKVHYISSGSVDIEWALLFKDADSCQRFQDRWIQSIVTLEKQFYEYEFAKEKSNIGLWWDLSLSKEANSWMKENKIRIERKHRSWLRFKTPAQAMAFKLRWI